MDGTATEIVLDEHGVCNFCHQAQQSLKEIEEEKKNFGERMMKITMDGVGKKYNCLIGLSGGTDSSSLLYYVVKYGLKPLCYTIDNGYNDPKADENIMRLVEGMKVPFIRYKIDLHKFTRVQSAFMAAGLKNIEIPTDHILMASALEMANLYDIKWILSGGNATSESIMPPSWGHNARDLTHIQSVYKRVFGKKLSGLPLCGIWKWNWYKWVKGIQTFYLLDYLDYNRNNTAELLKEFGWQEYGPKHEESLFTKWFQNFYLFQKFGIDKRKAHYSSLINAGQMTRKEAMEELTKSPEFIPLGIEQRVMKYPKREHSEFAMDKWYGRISNLIRLWRSSTTSTPR